MILTSYELKKELMRQLSDRFANSFTILLPDSKYYCPMMPAVERIVNESMVNYREYIPDKGDCDDSALLLHADFIKDCWQDGKRRYPYAAGEIWGDLPTPHAINWVAVNFCGCVNYPHIFFIEPQTDEIFLPRETDRNIFFIRG